MRFREADSGNRLRKCCTWVMRLLRRPASPGSSAPTTVSVWGPVMFLNKPPPLGSVLYHVGGGLISELH
eukprot:990860-Rhodomonas_salina.1